MTVAFKVAGNAPARMSVVKTREKPKNPWEPYYAWKPVKIGNKHVWNKWVFRKRQGKSWVYGTEFDVMRWSPD